MIEALLAGTWTRVAVIGGTRPVAGMLVVEVLEGPLHERRFPVVQQHVRTTTCQCGRNRAPCPDCTRVTP